MKTAILLSIAVGFTLLNWTGCKNEDTPPVPTPTSGRATVNNRTVNQTTSGFSFSHAANISFPNPSGVVPDIAVFVQTGQSGNIVGVYLARPDSLLPAFRLLRGFGSIDSASQYFQALREIPDTTYLDVALPVTVGEIWAVITRDNKYARILIRNTTAYVDSSTGTRTLYGETTFDWAYQPDGTRRF